MEKNNIILIGMPGAGKSTVGVILAKRLGFHFTDTDLLIQWRERLRLQQIIDSKGLDYFRHVEEQVLCNLQLEYNVIATGGSVIYYQRGLTALGQTGHLIYLEVPLDALSQRIANMGERGLVMSKGQSFEQLYQERTPLYEQHADITINCNNRSAEQVAEMLEETVLRNWPPLLNF